MKIFSGIQPTGALHIGNYLGMLKQSVELQKEGGCIYCVVDLHAMTIPYDPKQMQKNILDMTVCYLAAGIDPAKSILFIQSKVPEHTELAWILNTITPIGDLMRMTQYKDKSKQFKEEIGAGLLNYPVLMAADILLYKTQVVPVGKDQEQHVEFTRTLARKFNSKFGEIFKEPAALIPRVGAKIMSLTDPSKKMSKSHGAESYIALFDSDEAIRRKIKIAVTDSEKETRYDPKNKPAISNLITIYHLFADQPIKEIEKRYAGKGYADLKKGLAEVIIDYLKPLRQKREKLEKNPDYVKNVLEQGRQKAQKIAAATMLEVKKKTGLI